MNIPHGWHIKYNPKPIPTRRHDWDYWHDEVDNDSRLTGTAASEEDAKLEIMEKQAERCGFDKNADTPDDDDSHINIESLQYIIADMQRDLMSRDNRIAELENVAEAGVDITEDDSRPRTESRGVRWKRFVEALRAAGYLKGEGE